MTKKLFAALKAGAQYFLTCAGGTSFSFGLLILVASVHPFVSVPIIFSVGIICGAIGAYKAWKSYDSEILAENEKKIEMELLKKDRAALVSSNVALVSLAQNLDKRLIDIVASEQDLKQEIKSQQEKNLLQHQQDLQALNNAMKSTSSLAFFTPLEDKAAKVPQTKDITENRNPNAANAA